MQPAPSARRAPQRKSATSSKPSQRSTGFRLQIAQLIVTIVASIGVAGLIAWQNNATQLQIADLKGVQDRQLEQLKRQLSAPKLITRNSYTSDLAFSKLERLLRNPNDPESLQSAAADMEQLRNKATIVVLNAFGSQAVGVRVDITAPRPIESVTPRFPHEQAVVGRSASQTTVTIRFDALRVGDELTVDITVVPPPQPATIEDF